MRPLTPKEIETATTNPKGDIVALFVIREADPDRVMIENTGLTYFELLGVLDSLRHGRLATRMAEIQVANGWNLTEIPKVDE